MILPISIISVAACLLWSFNQHDPRSPLRIGLIVWAVGILMPALPLLSFSVDYSLRTDALIGGSLILVTAGYSLIRSTRASELRLTPTPSRREVGLALFLAAVGGAGLVVLIAAGGPRGFGVSALADLDSIRNQAFERLYSEQPTSPGERLGNLLAPAGLIAIIAAAHFGRRAGKLLLAAGIVVGILLTVVGIFIYGARSLPLYATLLAAIAFYLRGGRFFAVSAGRAVLAVVAAVAVVVLSVPFAEVRQENFNAENTLASIARARYHPLIEQTARTEPALGAALVSATYFGSTVPTLAYYLEEGDTPGPFYGRYSFPLGYQALEMATGDTVMPWVAVRKDVFSPLEGGGYYGNVWPTWLRDLVIDFGYLGALAFCFLFGSLMGWARNRSLARGGLAIVSVEAITCLIFAFGAFTSLIPFQFIIVALVLAMALHVVSTLRDWSRVRGKGGHGELLPRRTNAPTA